MAGLYANNGSVNVTVVSGSAVTGSSAADGSWNVFKDTGSVPVGAYHSCGAINVKVAPSGLVPIRSPSGALYVSESPFTTKGQRVTVVSGSL